METPESEQAPGTAPLAGRATQPLRWVHLSDLHVGCPGRGAWWQARDELRRELGTRVEQMGGPPDLVVITGDLAYSGALASADEYARVSELLAALRTWVGAEPVIVPVPGNHDLTRPERGHPDSFRFEVLDRYTAPGADKNVRTLKDHLWERRDPDFVKPLFQHYQDWLEAEILPALGRTPGVTVHASSFPGDLWVRLALPARPRLDLVGLNSAWLQWKSGAFERKLAVDPVQLQCVLAPAGGAPDFAALESGASLLLMHHPPQWLSRDAQRQFARDIYQPGRFDACLFGHLHEADTWRERGGDGAERAYFQAPSLLGLDHWGEGDGREQRRIGYAWGALGVDGSIRVWPYRLAESGGRFVFDQDRFDADSQAGHLLCPAPAGETPPPGKPTPVLVPHPAEPLWLDDLRNHLRTHHQRVGFVGIGRGELELDLDDIYVPLRIEAEPEARMLRDPATAPGDHGNPSRHVTLEDVLRLASAHGQHGAVLGDAGSGKTTALKKLLVTCLDDPARLGIEPDCVPLLLRLRALDDAGLAADFPGFIQAELDALFPGRFPGAGQWLWDRGRVLLLLDGLDEIADTERRRRAVAFVEAQIAGVQARGIRLVVASRFSGFGADIRLGPRFLHLGVRPLNDARMEDLVRLWFAASAPTLGLEANTAAGKAAALCAALAAEEYATQQIRVMVANPLLLTLLCAVVLRGGEIPHRRSEFYRECLETLLHRWSLLTREVRPPLDKETTLAVLRPLAWDLHRDGRRDDLSALEFAAHAEACLAGVRGAGAVSGFALLEWLSDEAGVLSCYAPDAYGFAHLGFQEYLAATHAAREGEVQALAAVAAQEWWQETILLACGLPEQDILAPLARTLLAGDHPREHAALLARCMHEALAVDPEPFITAMAPGAPREQRLVALRLLQANTDPRVTAAARDLAPGEADPEIAVLLRRLGAGPTPARADTQARIALLVHPDDQARGTALASSAIGAGVALEIVASCTRAPRDMDAWIGGLHGALAGAGPRGRGPWDARALERLVALLAQRGKPLAAVVLEGGERPDGPTPPALAAGGWINGRRGLDSNALARLQGWAGDGAETGATPDRPPGWVEPETGIHFLRVPAGESQMGAETLPGIAEEFAAAARPVHRVRLASYWLAETPITNGQYARFLEASGHREPEYWRDRRFSEPGQPVVGVSWTDARAFCRWLATVAGRLVDLPTEAQWERACRGADARLYPWGDAPPDDEHACFGQDWNTGRPAPAGSRPRGRGPFGHLDLAGNVWEWCRDAWDAEAYASRAQTVAVDPMVEGDEGDEDCRRVLRGGAWHGPAGFLAVAIRDRVPARRRHRFLGFRVAAALLDD